VILTRPRAHSRHPRALRPSEAAQDLTQRLSEALSSSGLLDAAQLCVAEGQHAWALFLDVYCLDADGGLFDAALLAAVAALADVRLPALTLRPEDGRPVALLRPGAAEEAAAAASASASAAAALPGGAARALALGPLPCALTCGLYKGHLLVDPCAEEEALMQSLVSVTLDADGTLFSVHKPGGLACASERTLMRCIAAARLRHAELARALAAAGVGAGSAPADMEA
jgi:exosome complex component RRP43